MPFIAPTYQQAERIAFEYLKENKYKVKKIHCNNNQSIVLLLETSGKVLTFGAGTGGRLGHGDTINQNTPQNLKDHLIEMDG